MRDIGKARKKGLHMRKRDEIKNERHRESKEREIAIEKGSRYRMRD